LVPVLVPLTRQGHCTYEYGSYGTEIRVAVPSQVTVVRMLQYLLAWTLVGPAVSLWLSKRRVCFANLPPEKMSSCLEAPPPSSAYSPGGYLSASPSSLSSCAITSRRVRGRATRRLWESRERPSRSWLAAVWGGGARLGGGFGVCGRRRWRHGGALKANLLPYMVSPVKLDRNFQLKISPFSSLELGFRFYIQIFVIYSIELLLFGMIWYRLKVS
jgi:hypothetical protein